MLIKNRNSFAANRLRFQVLDILEAGLVRVLPNQVLRRAVRFDKASRTLHVQGESYSCPSGRIFVIGGGKASAKMALELEAIVGHDSIAAGVVVCKEIDVMCNKIKVIETAHPVPDKSGVQAVQEILSVKSKYNVGERDLVVCLLSGGGSALLPCPAQGISLADKQKTTKLLLASGAEIHEINVIRKHLSRIKGGGLGLHFAPAQVVSLILSDVIGNDLDVIASGPTVPDFSTFGDAQKVLRKYGLTDQVPRSVLVRFEQGVRRLIEETPKLLPNCANHIIGDNRLALEAMLEKASSLGLRPMIATAEQKGEPAKVAWERAAEIKQGCFKAHNVILLGGETTPRLPKQHGKGGRNQHYAASTLLAMADYPGSWVAASLGTDGSDYVPDAAGALVDHQSLARAVELGLDVQDYLDRFDSYTLLSKLGCLIQTGNTGTNVGDVIVYLLG